MESVIGVSAGFTEGVQFGHNVLWRQNCSEQTSSHACDDRPVIEGGAMGELEQRLHDDMVTAMKERDRERTNTLRMAIAAIRNEKVAGKQARQLSPEEELTVLRREVNKRKESADAYLSAKRPELADKELAEAELLVAYLPEPLSIEELSALVDEEVAVVTKEIGQQPTIKQMGVIVKAVGARAEGRAEGRAIANAVRSRLAPPSK